MKGITKNIELNSQLFSDSIETDTDFDVIGTGYIGGKASGLAFIKNRVLKKLDFSKYRNIIITIPKLAVIASDIFDSFVERNKLLEIVINSSDNSSVAWAFQKASLPAEIVGELREIATISHHPLAVRSSSMLEDSLSEPFAGVYDTKMISNSSLLIDDRFKKLNEAVKFVYSSTYSNTAKSYFSSIKKSIFEEKMAVIIQQVAGSKRNARYYPLISGVARSYNFYPTGKAKPEDGVVNLALGLGKTIVDGGTSWVYSPKYPKAPPPYANPAELIKISQNDFWAVNVSNIYEYDPVNEIEYLIKGSLADAENDLVLDSIASTYSSQSDRLEMGTTPIGPRVIDFSPLLRLNLFGYNDFLPDLIQICEDLLGNPVEIEFAVDIEEGKNRLIFSLLQLRPMLISSESIDISPEDLSTEKSIIYSRNAFGNGVFESICDIVFLKPNVFNMANSELIAQQLEKINSEILKENRHMLLMGFGRWGSSDKWLGIPVTWGQISSTRTIIEIILPGMDIDLSQGSHFFHNLLAFKVPYFCIKSTEQNNINWNWINDNKTINETDFIKHVRTVKPLKIIVNGKASIGIIKNAE